jgi:DNA-binding NarL/FixJ family response regulator
MQAEEASARSQGLVPGMFIHRQQPADIAHAGYRHTCYGLPQVAERVAILAWYDNRYWMSINLYRGEEHGALSPVHLARIEALAPAMVEAVRLHHTGRQLEQDLAELMLSRLNRRCPGLTPRDHDVLRAILHGHDNPTLASGLGLTLSSAQTYVKRTFRKLGVGNQRELLALLMAPDG